MDEIEMQEIQSDLQQLIAAPFFFFTRCMEPKEESCQGSFFVCRPASHTVLTYYYKSWLFGDRYDRKLQKISIQLSGGNSPSFILWIESKFKKIKAIFSSSS